MRTVGPSVNRRLFLRADDSARRIIRHAIFDDLAVRSFLHFLRRSPPVDNESAVAGIANILNALANAGDFSTQGLGFGHFLRKLFQTLST